MADEPTLREVASARSFDVGTAVGARQLRTDAHYKRLLRNHFTAITGENALKMGRLRPEPGVYDFSDADAIVDFGTANDMTVRGHTLVWHNQQPDWFLEWNHTDEAIREFLREHVHTVAGRYRGRIDTWDVVNEAVMDDGSMRETVWYDAMGEEYLDLAFEWANEVAPEADLYYNDYDADEINEKSDGIYDLVSGMLDRGVPIDGVGLQLHALDPKPDPQAVAENVRRFQELGLDVEITEMDVAYPKESAPENHDEAQAEYYREVVEACLETGVDTLVVWGVRDSDSWIPGWFPHLTEEPLLFDERNNPKPAYHAVREALGE